MERALRLGFVRVVERQAELVELRLVELELLVLLLLVRVACASPVVRVLQVVTGLVDHGLVVVDQGFDVGGQFEVGVPVSPSARRSVTTRSAYGLAGPRAGRNER